MSDINSLANTHTRTQSSHGITFKIPLLCPNRITTTSHALVVIQQIHHDRLDPFVSNQYYHSPLMGPARNQSPTDSGDDSDIQEVFVVHTSNSATDRDRDGLSNKRSSPILKRRRSSPQMDPIPTYTPTPLHILEQRAHGGSSTRANHDYYPDEINYNPDDYQPYSSIADDDYTPLLHPSPHVIGCDTDISYQHKDSAETRMANQQRITSSTARLQQQQARRKVSSSTPRPVSSALAQAVGKRRNSLAQQQQQQQQQERERQRKERTTASSLADSTKSVITGQNSDEYAQEPVMWSPKVPDEVNRDDNHEVEPLNVEDYSKYQSVRPSKQRVAHKPTIPKNKNNRPRMPLGTSRKVPIAFRAKYLDVIINEFLNTGHKEEESYEKGLNEEKTLADRALSKMTYVNLVAGFKKKLREKAGVSTLPQDEDSKFVNGNKVVSHQEILTGKVRGTFSIERKRKVSDPSELNEQELYNRLSRYVMPKEELIPYGYPHRDPDNPDLRMAPLGKDNQKLTLRKQLAPSYTCERCAKVYRVGEDGIPLPTTGKCIFHPGHLWNVRISRALEKRYSCCKGDPSAGGCSSNVYHVHKGELEIENYKGYVETQPKPERDPDKHGLYALDCEMCYTTYGLELTRVTVINHKHDVVYEKLVKPTNPILDYNTKFSGIKAGDLDEIGTTLADVQRDLLSMFSNKTILVGHSLDSDMKALKIFHKCFIDTAQLFPHKRGLPFKRALRTLMVENLRVIIQEDAGHDSKEDACAALRLVMWKAKTDVPVKAS